LRVALLRTNVNVIVAVLLRGVRSLDETFVIERER